MKLPSLQFLGDQLIASLKRFYLALFFAITGSIVSIQMTDQHDSPFLTSLFFTCLLGLPAASISQLMGERLEKKFYHWLLPAIVVLLAFLYWKLLAPDISSDDFRPLLIFFVLGIALHLSVSFAPYLKTKEILGFWQFNQKICSRLLQSVIFSVVIFVSLALAIEACRILFHINFNRNITYKLWICVTGIFNTWYFLAGIPSDYEGLNAPQSFPKPLKIFTRYILLPITLIYMIILYAYGIKIIALLSLPKGWVSTLIICNAVVGILNILLTFPLRQIEEGKWTVLFSKWFFLASIPLLGLLYVAIWTRLLTYGVTEYRYYICLLGLWLAFITFYFLFSKTKNIKTIPVSLVLIAILSLVGPWSAFSVSKNSQIHRLEVILKKNNLPSVLKRAEKASNFFSKKDLEDIQGIMDYFIKTNSLQDLQPLFRSNIQQLMKDTYKTNHPTRYNWDENATMKQKLLTEICANQTEGKKSSVNYLSFYVNDDDVANIAGYNKLYDYRFSNNDSRYKRSWVYLIKGDSIEILCTKENNVNYIKFIKSKEVASYICLDSVVHRLNRFDRNVNQIKIDNMTYLAIGNLQAKIIFKSVVCYIRSEENNEIDINSISAWVLLK